MKYSNYIMIMIIIFALSFSTFVVAVPQNVKVGRGLMVQASPEETIFNIIVSIEGEKISLRKPAIIEFKIENISQTDQEVDFWNIIIRAERGEQVLPPSFSFKEKLNCKITLPKATFTSLKIPLDNIYKFDKSGEYIFRVQYELPNTNKVISSNDLKVVIEP